MKTSKRYTWISIAGHVVIILVLILFSSSSNKDDMIDPIQIVEAEPAPLPAPLPVPQIPEQPPEEKARLEMEVVEVPVEKKTEIDPVKRKIIAKPKPKPKPKIKPLPKIKPVLENKLKILDEKPPVDTPPLTEKKN